LPVLALALLQTDGRITLTDLADQVRLSVSRCQRRVRELERTGVIQGYQAKVDPAALDLGFEVLVFATLEHPAAQRVVAGLKRGPHCASIM
jgi:DNA-binding Lrp family transcriptional regulator